MGLLNLFRKKEQIDPETRRRQTLLRHGRITDGTIIESETDSNGRELVFYTYTVHGADFESSDLLTEEQSQHPLKYAPGAKVGIRYDPRFPNNSLLV